MYSISKVSVLSGFCIHFCKISVFVRYLYLLGFCIYFVGFLYLSGFCIHLVSAFVMFLYSSGFCICWVSVFIWFLHLSCFCIHLVSVFILVSAFVRFLYLLGFCIYFVHLVSVFIWFLHLSGFCIHLVSVFVWFLYSSGFCIRQVSVGCDTMTHQLLILDVCKVDNNFLLCWFVFAEQGKIYNVKCVVVVSKTTLKPHYPSETKYASNKEMQWNVVTHHKVPKRLNFLIILSLFWAPVDTLHST